MSTKRFFYKTEQFYRFFETPVEALDHAITHAFHKFGGFDGEFVDDDDEIKKIKVGVITMHKNNSFEIDIFGHLEWDEGEPNEHNERPTQIVVVGITVNTQKRYTDDDEKKKAEEFFSGESTPLHPEQ